MERLTVEQIIELQNEYGITEIQDNINSGLAWLLEGSYGRAANETLESGMCMLPEVPRKDYWGNIVPSRNDLYGTKGSLEHSQNFWQKVVDGEIDLPEPE